MFPNRILALGVALALIAPAPAQTPAPKVAMPLPPDTPLVVDGKVAVNAADFEGNMLRIPEERRAAFRMSYERVASVVDNVFIARSIAQKARDAGLDADPAVQARLQQVQDAFLADLYVKKVEKDAEGADLERRVRELYIADREKYKTDEEVRMQQILVGVKCRTKQAALELAKKARAEAVSSADFLAVATRYSDEGERADKGGDLGWGPVKAFVPQVREAVTKMKVGEISEPVESPFGYHVFKLLERKPGQQKPFEAVKKELIDAERAILQRRKTEELVASVRASTTVVTHRDNVQQLVTAGGALDPDELSRRAREAQKAPPAEENRRSTLPPEAK